MKPTRPLHDLGHSRWLDNINREKVRTGKAGESLCIELALEDLCRAVDLFRPVCDASHNSDGRVSMKVSPLLPGDSDGSIKAGGWFAARPSGTEDMYQIYAESFRGEDPLRKILSEAQGIVDAALAAH
jgi:hypothetical protein